MDLVPGMVTFYWISHSYRKYEILCAELCGVGHHAMRGFVQVDDANAYKQWLNDQSTFKALQEQVKLENNKELAFNKSN